MKLWINGQSREIEGITNLKELLEHLAVRSKTVVIEHNEAVVPAGVHEQTAVRDGDQIEIVHFVGGGREAVKKKKAAAKSSRKGPRKLVIVESPAKAKTINKFLGSDYLVEASMGHVRDLPRSKMGIDLEQGFQPQYIVIRKSQKTVTHLKKQAQNKDEIYLAPDPDREGEAISWHLNHIFSEINKDAKIARVEFNEITKEAVLESFKHPREIQMDLVDSQQARRVLDRIVGYQLSPLLWRKVGRGLSAGRVQSVALRLIVEREREIRSFVPEEYWTLEAKLASEKEENKDKAFIAKLEKVNDEKVSLKNREETEKIREEILSLPFTVKEIDKRERKRKPQAPYTTSKLQQEAYNRLGFPAAKTMRVAQGLYEGIELGSEGSVGLITYMRTDSVNIAQSAQKEAAQFVLDRFGKDYLPEKPPVYRSKKSAQEAHEAIRPTSVLREPSKIKDFLNDDEFKLYDLIWKKFVASQMTEAVDEHVAVFIAAGEKYIFKTTGRRNLFPGFGIVYDGGTPTARKDETKEETEKEMLLEDMPSLDQGEILKMLEIIGHQHFTKPPGRYNDASLVKTLEENGIGRPSTYAPTIYTLLSRDYVHRKGGALVPNELGETVVDLLLEHFPKVMDVEFTATMENELDRVEEGQMKWVDVIEEFYGPFKQSLDVALEKMKDFRREVVETDYKCEVCGKNLVEKWGRFGKFLACPAFPDCKFTRSMPTGAHCPEPNCKGDLVRRKSKKGRAFYGCSNYPECKYITNKLPKTEEGLGEDDQISDGERETIGP